MENFNFTFDNILSDELYLIIKELPNISTPSRDISYEQVPGRFTDLMTDNGRYENREIEVDCYFMDKVNSTDLNIISSNIVRWLKPPSRTHKKLTFSNDDEYFYEAIVTNAIDLSQQFKIVGGARIMFTCKPFKKRVDGEITKSFTKAFNVINPEIFDSEPYMKIYGNGTITLKINDQSIVFKNVSEYIEVDSEMMECFKGTTRANSQMTGSFPVFESGINKVSWIGSVSKIEVKGRWRCL